MERPLPFNGSEALLLGRCRIYYSFRIKHMQYLAFKIKHLHLHKN